MYPSNVKFVASLLFLLMSDCSCSDTNADLARVTTSTFPELISRSTSESPKYVVSFCRGGCATDANHDWACGDGVVWQANSSTCYIASGVYMGVNFTAFEITYNSTLADDKYTISFFTNQTCSQSDVVVSTNPCGVTSCCMHLFSIEKDKVQGTIARNGASPSPTPVAPTASPSAGGRRSGDGSDGFPAAE
jgi:hypothetical protein